MSDEETKPEAPNDGAFVGARDPIWGLEHERPWHRMACHLFAMGDSVKSVATKLDKSLPAVHNLIRQPWAQKIVTQLMAEAGQKDVTKLFRSEQFNNYSVLTAMRDDPNIPAVLRMKAAIDMLDRSMGKATQRVEMSHEVVSDDPVAEFNRLEAENKRLRKELNKGEEWKTGAGSRSESGLDPQ